jgi:hypothetical protein
MPEIKQELPAHEPTWSKVARVVVAAAVVLALFLRPRRVR